MNKQNLLYTLFLGIAVGLFINIGCQLSEPSGPSSPVDGPNKQHQALAKHNPQAIPDTCYAIQWDFTPDVMYSIFYANYRFQIHEGDHIHIEHYISPNRKLSYFADEVHYSPEWHRWAELDSTQLRTDTLTDSTRHPIIYIGDIRLYWRNLPRYKQYRVIEADTTYQIARILPDSSVVPIDFSSFHYRNERQQPPSIGDYRYFLPVNLDTTAWLDSDRGDIRPFLVDDITEVDCPERPVEDAGMPDDCDPIITRSSMSTQKLPASNTKTYEEITRKNPSLTILDCETFSCDNGGCQGELPAEVEGDVGKFIIHKHPVACGEIAGEGTYIWGSVLLGEPTDQICGAWVCDPNTIQPGQE